MCIHFQFIHQLGVSKKWALTDVYGTDHELLAMVPQPVQALILLYPYTEKVRVEKQKIHLQYYFLPNNFEPLFLLQKKKKNRAFPLKNPNNKQDDERQTIA